MIPLVCIPDLISRYGQAYADLFTTAGHAHFLRYLSGLLISSNKTVSGIASSFVLDERRDQSTLNRFLNHGRFDIGELNQRRLDVLQAHPSTRIKGEGKHRGVIGLDDTLLEHCGKHFEQIKVLWDHVGHRYVLAHNPITLYYGDDQVDYPLYFDLWEPVDVDVIEQGLEKLGIKLQAKKLALKQSDPVKWQKYLLGVCKRNEANHPEIRSLYRSKIHIGMDLITKFVQQYPEMDLPFTFDTWYTTPKMCAHIHQLGRSYVGALKIDKALIMRQGNLYQRLEDFIAQLKSDHLAGKRSRFEEVTVKRRGKSHTTFCYSGVHRIKNFGKVRLMISFNEADLSGEPRAYISNQLKWQAATMSRIYRHRWPVEPFHQQAKAQGLGKYQVRDFEAIKRHITFVIIVFSILTLARKDPKALEELRLSPDAAEQSLAFWQRLISAQAFIALALWIKHGVEQQLSLEQICEPLLKAFQVS